MHIRSEKNNDKTSPSQSQRLRCREISTGEKSINGINIPLDTQVEILKLLPVKSLMRFRCVSKQWSSIIDSRRDFIDSIMTRSLTQRLYYKTPLIFDLKSEKFPESHSFIFSNALPQNPNKKTVSSPCYDYVRGLILFWDYMPSAASIYNPTTRQSMTLPKMESIYMHLRLGRCFLGYDPVENQYKVLCMRLLWNQSCQVYTLGDPTKKWRNISCNNKLPYPVPCPVCINGTIYYRAKTGGSRYVLMSFDVRSETFDQVKTPKTDMDHTWTLINYQEKLGFMCCGKESVEIWVMEDAKKKQEWSKIFFYKQKGFEKARVAGVTRCGQIVIVKFCRGKSIKVYYYDPKPNTFRYLVVKGTAVEDLKRRDNYIANVWTVPDLVENTMRL